MQCKNIYGCCVTKLIKARAVHYRSKIPDKGKREEQVIKKAARRPTKFKCMVNRQDPKPETNGTISNSDSEFENPIERKRERKKKKVSITGHQNLYTVWTKG